MSLFFATYGYYMTAILNAYTALFRLTNMSSTIPNAPTYASNLTTTHKTASDLIAIAHNRFLSPSTTSQPRRLCPRYPSDDQSTQHQNYLPNRPI